MGSVGNPTYHGRYVHWDKLRRLPAPEGITHDEWWVAIKLSRNSQLKLVPLVDKRNQPFRYTIPDQAAQLLHSLDKDAAGQILMSDQGTNPEVRDRYIISSLMEEAITSSQIEGAATTRMVAKELLRSGRKPRDRGEQMIRNNFAAMQKIRTLADQPLTAQVLFDLHRILTQNAIDDPSAVGRFRLPSEDISVYDNYGEVLHAPPLAAELPERTRALFDFANGLTPDHFVHPVMRSIILHFWLAYDHPFVDGNGRCARALFYWSMLKQGYWLAEFISISEFIQKAHVRYGRAFLYTETDENDLTYFILYHLELIRKAIDSLQDYIRRNAAEISAAERILRDNARFNHRQIALLSHAMRHPDTTYSIASHKTTNKIAYETARTDLFDLANKGLLDQQMRGKAYYFYPARNLEEKMKRAGTTP